jgi:hypothetical protein
MAAERQATVEDRVDEATLDGAVRRLGWRVSSTTPPVAQWSLAQAGLASRHAYLVEKSVGRRPGRPLSLTPRYGQRDDHATGLMRVGSRALRVLTRLACSGRRRLATQGAHLAGLSASQAKRDTARPTAARLLEALREITLTVSAGAQQPYRHLTALSPLQQRMLELLGFSSALYTRLSTVSAEPP